MTYHGFYVLLRKDINSVFMSINSEIYELLSTNMYYLRATSLNCTIESQLIDGVENTFVVINPCELKTVEVNNSKLCLLYTSSEYETLIKAFDKDCASFMKRVGKDRSIGTYKVMVRARNYVAAFIKSFYKRNDMSMLELTPDFIKEFAAYLTAEPVSYTHLDVYKRQSVVSSLIKL